jgi:hypothetical protein
MANIWSRRSDELQQIVANSKSFSDIFRAFRLCASGAALRSLKRSMQAFGIDYSHIPEGAGANRGKRRSAQVRIDASVILVERSEYSRKTARACVLREGLLKYECAECGLPPEWNGKPLTLTLDHQSGVRDDHRIGNLRFLCPNCDTQSATFGGRNIKHVKKCPRCRIEAESARRLCSTCKAAAAQKSRSPDCAELKGLVWEIPTSAIARRYGVSDKAVEKWCKKHKIEKPGPGYWAKLRSQAPMV